MPSSIINSDDGVVSGTSGLKSVGGDDGVLVFQSKGTETARINTDKQIVAAAGTNSLPALTTTGDLNTGIYFPAADTIAFTEGGVEAMRIDSSGNVGIGTTSPGSNLDVRGLVSFARTSAGAAIQVANFQNLSSDTNSAVEIVFNNSTNFNANQQTKIGVVRTNSPIAGSTAMYFATQANGEAMRIDSSGNVGIGTTSPADKLSVSGGGITVTNGNVVVTDGTTSFQMGVNNFATGYGMGTTSNTPLIFAANNAERARITSGGAFLVGTTSTLGTNSINEFRAAQTAGGEGVLTVYNSASSSADGSPVLTLNKAMTTTTSSARFLQFYANGFAQAMGGIVGNGVENVQFATLSDVREKTNIQTISGSLNKINALNPVEFDWIKNGEHCPAGFVAQDVEQVFPEFVIENFSQEGQEPRKGLTGGMTGGIIPHLVKAIQELKAELDTVKAELATLKGN
jgi:hypothetical protein